MSNSDVISVWSVSVFLKSATDKMARGFEDGVSFRKTFPSWVQVLEPTFVFAYCLVSYASLLFFIVRSSFMNIFVPSASCD